jgi:hypothetical protein
MVTHCAQPTHLEKPLTFIDALLGNSQRARPIPTLPLTTCLNCCLLHCWRHSNCSSREQPACAFSNLPPEICCPLHCWKNQQGICSCVCSCTCNCIHTRVTMPHLAVHNVLAVQPGGLHQGGQETHKVASDGGRRWMGRLMTQTWLPQTYHKQQLLQMGGWAGYSSTPTQVF